MDPGSALLRSLSGMTLRFRQKVEHSAWLSENLCSQKLAAAP
jgi:hypothetical protein